MRSREGWIEKALLRSFTKDKTASAVSVCRSLCLLLTFSHHQQHFWIMCEMHLLTVTVSLSFSLSLCFSTHLLVFPHFSECPPFPLRLFQALSSSLHFLHPYLSLSPSIPLLLWYLSTGRKCPAEALAVAQWVADFIVMAALYRHGRCLSLRWPVSCNLVLVQLACV